jgi:hypothetical protein
LGDDEPCPFQIEYLTFDLILSDIITVRLDSIINFRLREKDMNWKLLSVTLVGFALVACDGKKEEKKAEEATPPEAVKVEEPKPAEAAPAPEAPKEEPKHEEAQHEHNKDEAHHEHHAEEKKAS